MSFLKQAISQKHGPNDTLFLSTKKGLSITPKITGVTLLSVLGKLFTRILTSWAESLNVYIEAQAGFRSGMSISDNIFVLTWYNYTYVNQGKNCIVVSWILVKRLIMLNVTAFGLNS